MFIAIGSAGKQTRAVGGDNWRMAISRQGRRRIVVGGRVFYSRRASFGF